METLNQEDLDWLTRTENRLIRMRKREAANTNSPMMIADLTTAIQDVDDLRGWLAARLMVKAETIRLLGFPKYPNAMTTKYDIKRGEVHLAKYGHNPIPLDIIDVLERADGETMIRHNYGWESLTEFIARRPARMGRIRKILGIRCGIIREPNA